MTSIRLMVDYHCFPLWWGIGEDTVGNISPDQLPISTSLGYDLIVWASAYDATLNPDDPLSSGFSSAQAQQAFRRAGYRLARRLQEELGDGYTVSYKEVL